MAYGEEEAQSFAEKIFNAVPNMKVSLTAILEPLEVPEQTPPLVEQITPHSQKKQPKKTSKVPAGKGLWSLEIV